MKLITKILTYKVNLVALIVGQTIGIIITKYLF